jgi:hypothetical protein
MVLMSDSYQNDYKLGSIYYNMGSNTPFTGILYGKYVNGNYQTKQEYVMVLVMESGLILVLKALKNVKEPIRTIV